MSTYVVDMKSPVPHGIQVFSFPQYRIVAKVFLLFTFAWGVCLGSRTWNLESALALEEGCVGFDEFVRGDIADGDAVHAGGVGLSLCLGVVVAARECEFRFELFDSGAVRCGRALGEIFRRRVLAKRHVLRLPQPFGLFVNLKEWTYTHSHWHPIAS